MRSDRERSALVDILDNIALAGDFVQDHTFETFLDDRMRVYAEIISEASRRLTDGLKKRHPEIAWREMAGAGNVYRHDYENVAATRIWNTIRIALPLLRAVVVQELGNA